MIEQNDLKETLMEMDGMFLSRVLKKNGSGDEIYDS